MATPEELSNRYMEISRSLIRKSQEELDVAEDYIQASEKAWGSVAAALKSVAAGQGWNHKSHGLLSDIAFQLYLEFGRPRLADLYKYAEALHNNFYEHRIIRDEVQLGIDRCRELLDELERIRTAPSRRFTPATREQERRMERLTRRNAVADMEDESLDISALPPV